MVKLEAGQKVTLLFRTGISISGTIINWEKGEFIIKTNDEKSLLIIPSPKDDIMAIKVLLESNSKENINNLKVEGNIAQVNDKDKLIEKQKEQLAEFNSNTDDSISEQEQKLKTLASLRLAKAKEDRDIIANKFKDHNISEIRKVEYGLPGFLKKSST